MPKNLMEAAADILSRSKAAAPGMPMEKAKGEVQDLGGVTPTDPIPGEGEGAAKTVKKATAPGKPASVGAMPMPKAQGQVEVVKEEEEKDEDEDEDEKDEKEEKGEKEEKDEKESMKEDVDAILASEKNLSEDFRSKVVTIYEARINDRVSQIQEEMEAQYTQELTEAVQQLETQLVEKIDGFLSYVVEEWMEQNEVAIEKGLRSELTEEFISGLRNLFAEHYISVPEERVELVDELAERVEQLENELNETVSRNIEMKKQLTESKKQDVIGQVCEGLTQTQTEKIRSLVESVEFTSEDEFQKKAETIRENYFPTTVKAASAQMLNETVEQPEGQKEITDPIMKKYAEAISKSVK